MPNKNTLSGMMLEGQEPEETKEIRTDIQGGEEMQIMMFLTNGRLGQGGPCPYSRRCGGKDLA